MMQNYIAQLIRVSLGPMPRALGFEAVKKGNFLAIFWGYAKLNPFNQQKNVHGRQMC
jgi:hypothetical protein